MRKKRLVNVLTSAALTAALVMSMGMTAMAADYSGDGSTALTSINLSKTITWEEGENIYAPSTTFNFSVESGTAGTITDASGKTQKTIAGTTAQLSAGSVSYSKDSDELLSEDTATKTGTLTINSDEFSAPGIYVYKVTETNKSTDDDAVEGMIYTNVAYNVYLYVVYVDENDASKGYKVVYATAVKLDENGTESTSKTDTLSFTNDYGKEDPDDPTKPNDSLHDVTISKTVTGNQKISNDTFTFTIKINGASGEVYYTSDASNGNKYTSGEPYTVTLADGGSVKIEGLSVTDTVTVTEGDAKSGYTYTMSVSGNNLSGINDEDGNLIIDGSAVSVTADGATISYVNDLSTTTPTGIILNFAPYILLVAFAGVFAVLFLGKRKNDF